MKQLRLSLLTFLAVFAVLFGVGAIFVPVLIDRAQAAYYQTQAEVNARQAAAMQRFVEHRLAAGASQEQVIEEFQAAIAGTDTDRGYVCLIDENRVQYLCHPDLATLGMSVKPHATFAPNFEAGTSSLWQEFLRRGTSASGLLDFGINMPKEIVHFTTVSGINWTVSSHENTARIQQELSTLRSTLLAAALALGVLVAFPASLAARYVSRRHERQLTKQHHLERDVLEAENARRTEELEKARHLQLSMLPKTLPELPHVELAAHMQTATEVGGDYYDFHHTDDDTLLFAIGDATGHGLHAGTMVTATKSLFTHLSSETDLVQLVKQATQTIHRIGLPKMYMALALGKLKGHTLELVGAGLPPALLYRAATGVVEEIPLKGMPLGGFVRYPYRAQSVHLEPGDTLLLMTDGFPEHFNPDREMIGYAETASIFQEVASQSPQAIIEHLKATALEWANGPAQDDDITFVVMHFR